MKKILFGFFALIVFASCDVDTPIAVTEEPVIEKTTLTILNLPENTTVENLKQVTVGNVAVCGNPAESAVEGTTALVPLLSPDGKTFAKTGVYMIQLVLENPDKTLLQLDGVPVEFENGYGTLDLTKIPEDEPPPPPPRGLRILNLPANTIAASFKNVTIGNTAACNDFTAVEVENGAALAPLELNNGNGEFTKTGMYIVSLTLDVDSLTFLEITAEDRVAVEFVEGYGVLDLADYGEEFLAARFLTILNMPPNAETDSFQSLNIGDIAKAMMDEIKIEGSTAVVPITLNNGKEFNKTGMFFIALRVIIDSLNDIDITKDDFVMVKFENGNGTLDLHNLYGYLGKGYLEGDITNRTNFYEAQVKKDTRFEMNGYFYRVITQAPMDNLYQYAGFANTTLYIYAVETESNVVDYKYVSTMRNADEFIRFRLSTVRPVYNAEKCGYYNGNERAFWKFIKINGEWRWKTDIDKGFEVENQVLSAPIGNILHRWENTDISPTQVWLEAGVYCFEAAGAKGGDSKLLLQYDATAILPVGGGEGGRIIELVSIQSGTYVTVYTGKSGKAGSEVTPESLLGLFHGNVTDYIGISGGGGGAGSFISYNLGQPGDYILCAGGGAGAAGLLETIDRTSVHVNEVRISSGGAGGSVDSGGNSGGIPVLKAVGHYVTETVSEGSAHEGGGSSYEITKYVLDGYKIEGVSSISAGGGAGGIGNITIGEIKYQQICTGVAGHSAYYYFTVNNSEVKALLTSYLSTIEIGGAPATLNYEDSEIYLMSNHSFENLRNKAEELLPKYQGNAGGNNRTSTRGGNSGNGYVRIYSLN